MTDELIFQSVHTVVVIFEGLGIAAMALGFLTAALFAIRALVKGRGGAAAFGTLRRMIGASILLGLEILVAADLIRTISAPTLEEAVTLGLIVLIRTILSISIQIEIEGVLPWKRALLTSGGQVLADTVAKETKW
ncbi:DUF1622 domain-containing protein [Gulosibacter molinativorax]|uniref:DUF1622 domain-containing protein n=1 Tax=Gulosibacter molinativorax TaxID=256821 RepID=A0ABT7C547_9MICO|nr:DUF1622 domain-containing protein [Gulosibacter molinativorax]MDJ1370316.1 DUF1622 domain-containing protein [Gulosibacter molinativorax]QUY61225.1 Asparagine synthetase [glutamine-hydrolyzing] AsnH [Gulosibacter molinativorax]